MRWRSVCSHRWPSSRACTDDWQVPNRCWSTLQFACGKAHHNAIIQNSHWERDDPTVLQLTCVRVLYEQRWVAESRCYLERLYNHTVGALKIIFWTQGPTYAILSATWRGPNDIHVAIYAPIIKICDVARIGRIRLRIDVDRNDIPAQRVEGSSHAANSREELEKDWYGLCY